MHVAVEVKNRKEADAVRVAMDDPAIRAFVLCCGALLPLSPRARERVFAFVKDRLDEEATAPVQSNDGNGQ